MGRPLRLRPRDGCPRRPLEYVAQFMWRWRLEILLLYIAGTATWAIAHAWLGIL